ncbi:MAG: Segregation and condensation protein B [Nitrospira sp.]|nr:MAG: Segregation and condensation protein B [Nitrospira sp.]
MTPITDDIQMASVEVEMTASESVESIDAAACDLSVVEVVSEGAEPAAASAAPDASGETESTGASFPEGAQANTGAVQAIAERELRGIIESLLFVSPEPISVQRLVAIMGDVTKVDVAQALRGLGEELDQEGRGVRLVEIAGGFRLVTKQEYATWIKRLDKTKSAAKLSRSALESLAIIAYKQPIVRSEIEEIRGVETSGVVRTLLERKLVRIVGRKEVPGRPIMYGTTKFFLEHFGLNDLTQLPPLREFTELGESDQSLLPMETMEVAMPTAAEEAVIDSTTEAIMGLNEAASASTDAEETVVELRVEEEITVEIEANSETLSVEEESIPKS